MIRRLVAAAVMVAAAAVLALLARDAWHWGRAIEDADARARVRVVGADAWQADATLPWGLARRALGIGDDLAFRQTIERAIRVAPGPGSQGSRKVRGPIETALARTVAENADRTRAAIAADYLGYFLYFETLPQKRGADPYGNQGQSGSDDDPVAKAIGQFEQAVLLDPANVNAKRNLEALLRSQSRPGDLRSQAASGGSERVGKKGAGSHAPGNGY